jgi:ATP-dependent protease Clp ATPase subunit
MKKVQPIVGQEKLVKEINKIFDIFKHSNCVIRPHFLLTGSSGSGKSFTVYNVAKGKELNYMEINAAQLTKEGVSGNSLSKALSPIQNFYNRPTVIFVDEFDKLFISGNSNSSTAHESTTGVQNEFLKILEADHASVFGDYGKFINVPMKNMLLVFGGAFNGEKHISIDRLRELGLKTEFLGRVPLVYNTEDLSLDNLYEILESSPLLASYLELFPEVDRESTIYTLKAFIQKNYEFNTLGARMVNTIINKFFIKGGKLEEEELTQVTFQNKLTLD